MTKHFFYTKQKLRQEFPHFYNIMKPGSFIKIHTLKTNKQTTTIHYTNTSYIFYTAFIQIQPELELRFKLQIVGFETISLICLYLRLSVCFALWRVVSLEIHPPASRSIFVRTNTKCDSLSDPSVELCIVIRRLSELCEMTAYYDWQIKFIPKKCLIVAIECWQI